MARSVRPKQFASAAKPGFAFLAEHGFRGPIESETALAYSIPSLILRVLYDEFDGRVLISIGARTDRGELHASLDCLYVEAGLGPAQDIKDIARSTHSLTVAIESHASALRRFLPVLTGPNIGSLVEKCAGR